MPQSLVFRLQNAAERYRRELHNAIVVDLLEEAAMALTAVETASVTSNLVGKLRTWQHGGENIGPLLDAAATQIEQLEAEIKRLQCALNFWLPSMREGDSIEYGYGARISEDASLLACYDGPLEPCADELGWVKLPPSETFAPKGAGGNPRALVCCEGIDEHAPGCALKTGAGQ